MHATAKHVPDRIWGHSFGGGLGGIKSGALAGAGRDLVSKLSWAIPKELRPVVLDASSKPIQTRIRVSERFDGALLRHPIRERYRLQLVYTDRNGSTADRIVWPLLIAFLDRARYLVGWCETKEDYRHFKTERVVQLQVLGEKYPGRRATLLKGWEAATARPVRG